MTRKEFLCTSVEQIINNVIIPTLNERDEKNTEMISKLNMAGFLYSVSRLDPLVYLMEAARQLTDEEFECVKNKIKED